MQHCTKHGLVKHYPRKGASSHRCSQCSREACVRRSKKVKEVLVTEHGGRCVVCGYDRYLGALHFHHTDPSQKEFQLGGRLVSIERMRAEAAKCVLLCSNCHSEVEAGITTVPSA